MYIINCEIYFENTTVILALQVKNATSFTVVYEICINYPIWKETNNLFTLALKVSKNHQVWKMKYQNIFVGYLK